MTHLRPYTPTEADTRRFASLEPQAAASIIRDLKLCRYLLGIYTVHANAGTCGSTDTNDLMMHLAGMAQALEKEGLSASAEHLSKKITALKIAGFRSPEAREQQCLAIGRDLKSIKEAFVAAYSRESIDKSDKNSPFAEPRHQNEEFLNNPAVTELSRVAGNRSHANQNWAHMALETGNSARQDLASALKAFLEMLTQSEVADVFLHATDKDSPLPDTFPASLKKTLNSRTVRDAIIASVNAPTTMNAALMQANAALSDDAKPLFTLKTDVDAIVQGMAALDQARMPAPATRRPTGHGGR